MRSTPLTFRSTCLALAALGALALHPLLVAAPAANGAPADLDALARRAAGDDAAAEAAAGALRAAGPAGMAALRARAADCSGTDCAALRERLDGVCGVRDCGDIGLYWYTDLDQARAAALESGKPILSLRLMGRLDEEFSCANSRYFRTVLYKNAAIADLLRERFVLHWRSVRPVPKVTIDFGDGARLERTFTGNSIHYVLDSRGRLVEAIPGLYGPATFRALLEGAERAAHRAAGLVDSEAMAWMSARAGRQLEALQESLSAEYASLGGDGGEARLDAQPPVTASKRMEEAPIAKVLEAEATLPAALDRGADRRGSRAAVGRLATASKMDSEAPLTEVVLGEVADDMLRELAALRRPRVHLDAASRRFLLAKHGPGDPLGDDRLVDGFESTVALDEVINEYGMRPQLLARLSALPHLESFDLESFNGWVYEQVFGTPLSDPWLGLAPLDRYTALPASSRTTTAATEVSSPR